MPESPLVSVIVPAFNRAAVLPRALESVFAQTCTDWELIVVDDASTDDTERVVQQYDDPRMRYLRHEENRGASAARNTGIRAARGRFLAFLDSDDQWLPHKLAAQLAVFETSPHRPLNVVGCGMTLVRRGQEITRLPTARGGVFSVHLRRRLGVWDTSTLCVRTEPDPVLFDESLPAYQDFDYLARHLKRGAFDYVAEPLVLSHEDAPGPRVSDRNLEGRLAILRKYADELARHPEALSHHQVRIALKYAYRGNLQAARHHFRQAVRAYPQRWQHWVWWAASLLGIRPALLATRAFRHETTR